MAKNVLDNDDMRKALDGKLIISVCAGVRIKQLKEWLPQTGVSDGAPA